MQPTARILESTTQCKGIHGWSSSFPDPNLTPGVGGVAVAAMAGPGRATVDHHLPEDGMQQRETLDYLSGIAVTASNNFNIPPGCWG